MTGPIRVNTQSINIIAGDKLRPGDVISARVLEVLPGNKFRIIWNGRILSAESHLNLQKGQLIHARVEKGLSAVVLKLLNTPAADTPAPSSFLSSSQSPQQVLTSAFLRASMPLPRESEVLRMSALLGRSKGRRMRLARLQADLVSRGADPSADFLEALDELLSDRRGDGGAGQRKRRNWPDPPNPSEVKASAEEADSSRLLQLINSCPGGSENWMFRRSAADTGGHELQLVWKIRRGARPGLALTVYDKGRTLEFLLEGLHPARMSVYCEDGTEIGSTAWNAFRERLSLMNIAVDDTILPMEASDGFSPGDPA